MRLTRASYETANLEVPVYAAGTTKVHVEMLLMRDLAQQNLEAGQGKWRKDHEWNQIVGWTKGAIGGVVALTGAGYTLGSRTSGDVLIGMGISGLGVGLLAWGVVNLLNPPLAPVPEWELEHKATVTPPAGSGDVEIGVLQSAPQPPSVR